MILGRIVVEGWWAARRGERGRLGDDEIRWVFLFLVVLFFLLSLGPVILYGGRALDHGLYAYLYPYVLPLHAMRVYSRIGIIVVLGVGLLAGMGARALQARLPGRPWRLVVPALLLLGMLAEYAPFPVRYQRLDWEHPPAVYRALAADPDDVAVLEWPQNLEDVDDYFTFMSINHWKRIVNGASGFSPDGPLMTRDISGVLSTPDDPEDDPFPGPAARRYLLGIHPLRYVVVHNALLERAEQEKWRKLATVPWARLVGRYGRDDLYRLSGDMAGPPIEKFFSWDYARDKTTVDFEVRAIGPGAQARWIDIGLNGHGVARQELGGEWARVTLPLAGPRRYSAPNVVSMDFHYRDSDARSSRRIGRTGVTSPVDLQVVSAGKETGDEATIYIDAHQRAVNLRGYNLVAIDPTSGDVLWSDRFDTLRSPGNHAASPRRSTPPCRHHRGRGGEGRGVGRAHGGGGRGPPVARRAARTSAGGTACRTSFRREGRRAGDRDRAARLRATERNPGVCAGAAWRGDTRLRPPLTTHRAPWTATSAPWVSPSV